jgi:CRP/FNR family transcriptional regulator, cyclic AMP receptor protein
VHQSRIAALQAMPIFGGVRADVLDVLVTGAKVAHVGEGAYFFREGERAESMFVLESGEVAILKGWSGEQHELRRLGAGECFGEMALLDLFPRSASVQAVTACTALELSAASLFSLYETDLEQFALVQMNIARELSRRLRTADERMFRARVVADPAASDWSLLLT